MQGTCDPLFEVFFKCSPTHPPRHASHTGLPLHPRPSPSPFLRVSETHFRPPGDSLSHLHSVFSATMVSHFLSSFSGCRHTDSSSSRPRWWPRCFAQGHICYCYEPCALLSSSVACGDIGSSIAHLHFVSTLCSSHIGGPVRASASCHAASCLSAS